MKNIILTMILAACSVASSKGDLKVKVHAGSEAAFLANSYLIEGEKEAVLIDAQFLRSEAIKVSQMIKDSKKELKFILITHAHPDHHLGLEILVRDFPKAKVYASEGVIQEINAITPGKLKYWSTIYKDDLATSYVRPKVLPKNLSLEGTKIEAIEMLEGESEHATVFKIGDKLFTGDVTFKEVHLWLAEKRPSSWLTNLDNLKNLNDVKAIYSGHGTSDGRNLISTNETYISDFEKSVSESKSKEEAKARMTRAYDYKLPIILDISLGSYLK